MNSYELSRAWFDFAFENPEKISPNHSAIYFFAIEHCNRLGWKTKFGFPTQMAMDAIGIKKHQTYIRYFNELVEWGFFILVQKSANQYSSNIISLISAMPKNGKAMDKANIIHAAKQIETNGQSTGQSNSSIDKQINNKPINNINQVTEICNLFAFTEMSNFVNYKLVYEFIEMLEHSEMISQFIDHFEGYKIHYKKQVPKYRHSLNSFLGTPENRFVDGKWNDAKYLLELPPKPEKKIINPAHYNKYEVYVFKCKNFSTEPPISETEWRLAQPE